MALDRYGGGDYSQAGQQYAQFAPRRRSRYGMQDEQQAVDQALGSAVDATQAEGGLNQGQFQPTYGGVNPNGAYSGTATARPTAAAPTQGTSAADQLTQQQAVANSLGGTSVSERFKNHVPEPIVPRSQMSFDDLIKSIQVRGGGTGLERGVSTAAQIGSAALGIPSVAAGLGLGAWGGPIGMGIGAGISAIMGDRARHKANIANDIRANDARAIVAALYREKLGREGTPEEIDSHIRNAGGPVSEWVNPGQYNNAIQNIINSPEAQAYATRQAASTPASTTTTTTAPTAPSSSTGGPMTDPAQVTAAVTAAYQKYHGREPSPDELSYWLRKATTPEEYSDHKIRVGWNPYWEDRLRTGSASSDPSLAGDVGVVGYGGPEGPTSSGGGGSGPTNWAYGGANDITRQLIQQLMAGEGVANVPAGDQTWAYGGAIDSTQALIRKLMQEAGVAGALR